MNDQQIKIIQQTFAMVVPIADTAADLFYTRLFELDPSLKKLFKSDLTLQGAKLMKMLGYVVNGLNNLDALIPAIQDLGRRHVDYGVTSDMYETVGLSLLWTLEKGLGPAYTEEAKEAWCTAYTILKNVMCDAAYNDEIA
ncbi:globin family protein [Marinicellulosiphila megalodicopiae]|uniref:globin family protein n=1 Tax=Marinicellulosiphila megalodicopiae TaxID=2724896 RepID=UPI003BAFE435